MQSFIGRRAACKQQATRSSSRGGLRLIEPADQCLIEFARPRKLRRPKDALRHAAGERLLRITQGTQVVLELSVPYLTTFAAAGVGKPLLYLNSLDRVALAIDEGNFAEQHHIRSGPDWSIRLSKRQAGSTGARTR